MPVPGLISDLTSTPATNSPAGSESAKGVVDDYLRAHGAFIRQLSDIVQGGTVTLPSATSVAIGFTGTLNVAVTGTTTINGFDSYAEGAIRYVQFLGAMTLTYNAVSLILPGAANIVTVSGDVGIFKSLGAGKWVCLVYQRGANTLTSAQVVNALGFTPQPALGYTAANVAGQAFTGNISAPVITQTSDERTKCNWRALTNDQLDAIGNMPLAGLFEWIDGGRSSLGGSAQQIRSVIPEAVHEDDKGRLTVNYGGLCFALVQAMLRREKGWE